MQHDRAIEALDKTTVRRLHSGQVIVDIDSIVKELIENALDANARSIDVKLVDNGLKLVQVKDDGHGIDSESRPLMGQRYHTSKITSMDDLKHLTTLGFRGEALNSICALSETFQITTKTENDTLAMQYELDRSGNQTSHQPIGLISHTGTLVSAYKPFFNVPVRQQMIQRSFSFKRIQDLLTRYSLIYPEIRFALTSSVDGVGALSRISGANKWVKPATTGIMKSIATVYGSQLVDMLEHHRLTAAADQLSMECVLAKPNADPATVYRGERVHVYINKRPVNHAKCDLKEIVALARKRYNSESSKKTPFMFVSIQLNGDQLDVNLEPSKMAVMLHHKQTVIELFENLVERIYRSPTHRLFGTVQQRADDHINYERLQEPELSPSSLQEAPSIASAGDNSSLPAQMELQEAASAHVGATDNVLADTNQTSGRGTEMRENSQTKNVEKPITHGTNDTLHDISNPTPIGSKEIPSQASDAWIDSLKRMDVDMPSLDIQLQRQLIQLPAINEQEKQHPDNINDEEVDEDEQESAAGDTGVWKFSMCSQGMSSSSSSSNDDTDERDQLLLSEDENDLQVCVEETGPRVRSLTEWLKQPCKQQQRQDQQQPAQVPTTAPPSAISRPTGAIKPSISSAVPEAVLVVNNTATTTARISPQITLPAVTELSERPTLNTESTASSSTRPMRDPQRFSPLATARSLPQQREEQISCAPVSSSSVAATPRPPTATPTRLISRARRSNRQLFVETSPDFEPQLSTNEESQWQVDPVSLNGRREPSSMILDIRQQPQRQASAPLTENQAKNSHPTSNNRSLYDMFRMQQSNRLSLPPVAPSLPVRTATEKGKSDLTRHHPSITEHPTLPPHPAIAQHQSHPTLSSVLSSPSDSSVATASIPRKRKRNTLFTKQPSKVSALFDTLNLEMPLKCNATSIPANYLAQYQRWLRYHRVRLDRYPASPLPMSAPPLTAPTTTKKNTIVVHQFPLYTQDMCTKRSLAAYSKSANSVHYGASTQEIGIIDRDRMKYACSLSWFLKHHELACRKRLEKPIAVEISQEDPYFSTIASLQGRDNTLLDQDGQNRLFKVVTDRRITANGFQCRWRKLDRTTMLLQITSIHDLGGTGPVGNSNNNNAILDGYGIADLRELLSIIQQRNQHQHYSDKTDLSQYRPSRVTEYFERLSTNPASAHHYHQEDAFRNGDSNNVLRWEEVEDENGETYAVGVSNSLSVQKQQQEQVVACCALYRPCPTLSE